MRAIVLSVFITDRLGQEMFRVRYATLAAALTLLLTIAPVYAAPNLKVGSTASFSLASSVSATQSCSASPASYYNEACLGIYPSTSFVTIYDNLTCTETKFSCGFTVNQRCSFQLELPLYGRIPADSYIRSFRMTRPIWFLIHSIRDLYPREDPSVTYSLNREPTTTTTATISS